jgi:GH25 family lysozyme M1 (1,4-beta-N-acetylmuramidase)
MLKGIDVSTWQGQIDWEKAKKEIDFVILRLGFGVKTLDNTAKRNIEELNRLGIPYGVYWFSYAYTEEMARNEAKKTIEYLKELGANLSYPVYFDWEGDSRDYAKKKGVTVSNDLLRKMATAFCEELKKAGYYPGIYSNPSYIKNYYGADIFKKYDLWLAHWVSKTSYEANVWQYSDKGTVAGINGRVDMNYCYVCYPAIINGAQNDEEETTDAKFSVSKWGVYTVTPEVGLWLRNGASTEQKAFELMPKGAKVICYGFYNGKWYMVASESGKVGFCHSDYLEKVE